MLNKLQMLAFSLSPVITVLNNNTTSGAADNVMTKVLSIVVTIAGGLIACFLIYSIAKDAFEFAKGQGTGSVWKIIGKVLFLILCIGLIFLAQNWQSLGDKAKSIGEGGLNIVEGGLNEIVGGNGG